MKTIILMFAALCVAVSLTACGGGGGGTSVVRPGPVDPIDPPVAPSQESLSLPSGHGLSAGTITVAAGDSAEHGNVVVSCPAGGSACVVTVMVDGTASYERTGGVPGVMAAYGSWSLPSGHGLAAGTITVAAGASDEHGNVVVSCPAGGSACVVTVMVDGTASYDRTGGVPGVMAAYGSWSLPSGHGLAAGTITVAAGASDEHGNVLVSCPAGGSACVVTVAADGTASYDRTGGVPTVMVKPVAELKPARHWQKNPFAEDISEHWNMTDALQSALRLRRGDDDSKASLATLISGAASTKTPERRRQPINVEALIAYVADLECYNCGTERADLIRSLAPEDVIVDSVVGGGTNLSAEDLTLLRNIDVANIQIIGSRNGITHGQWKGGPAGTLDIDFYWEFSPQVKPEVRARYEQAGKYWSYRILDDFGVHKVQKGMIYDETNRFADDVTVDGSLMVVMTRKGPPSGGAIRVDIDDEPTSLNPAGDYKPWLGQLTAADPNNPNMSNLTVNAHEIGHALGISGRRPDIYVEGDYWIGPATTAANDGEKIRFRDCQFAGCSDPQQTTDFNHLSGHRSILSYERHDIDRSNVPCSDPFLAANGLGCNPNPKEFISEIDFGYLSDIGYSLLEKEEAEKPETYGFAAWGNWSAWGIGIERVLYRDNAFVYGNWLNDRGENDPLGGNYVVHDEFRATADAFGVSPAADFGATHSAMTGSASYRGNLLGVDTGQATLPPVVGDAELQIDLSDLTGMLRFGNLTVLMENTASPFRQPDLSYAIEVGGNSFSDTEGYVAGGFFGPSHEEMAGILKDPRSDVNLLGAFGGRK